jgi:STAS-like domain of unknown function (DUF4325)
MNTVNVARDFTRFPAGRYKRNGETSGEEFRQRFLEGPLGRGEKLVVELDGTLGYGSSFLEEAFGGAVRSLRLPAQQILDCLQLDTADSALRDEIIEYITDAARNQT